MSLAKDRPINGRCTETTSQKCTTMENTTETSTTELDLQPKDKHCRPNLVSELFSKKKSDGVACTNSMEHCTQQSENSNKSEYDKLHSEACEGKLYVTDPLEHVSCLYADVKTESASIADHEAITSNSENSDVDIIKSEVPTYNSVPVQIREWNDDNVNPACNDCQGTIQFYDIFKCCLCTVCFQQRSKNCSKFSCNLCTETFKSYCLMSKHLESHSQVGNYECNLCDSSFCSIQLLECHLKLKHVTDSDFKCPICALKDPYNSLQDLLDHISSVHAVEETVSPETCNEPILSRLEQLGTEMSVVNAEKTSVERNTHCSKVLNFPCIICKDTFSEQKELAKHIKLHIEDNNSTCKPNETNEKTNLCSYCGKFFSSRKLLYQHISLTHQSRRTHKCQFCDKAYKRSSVLQNHIQAKHEKKKFQCTLCGNLLSSINSYHSHMKKHRTKNKEPTLKCPLCPKMFKLKKYVDQHMRTHTGETPFKCSYCPREFTNKWNCIQHERLHRGEKRYKCEKCGKAFTHNVSKKNHMKYHRDEIDTDFVTKEHFSGVSQ